MASLLFRPLLRTRTPAALIRSNFTVRTFATTLPRFEIIKRFTEDHEWVSLDTTTSIATIGITKYAADSLGDVVYVELPSPADEVSSGEAFGAVESVKSASDIMSPVDGEVVEKNEDVESKPGEINRDPEGSGWLVKVKVAEGEGSVEGLLGGEEYEAFCKNDSH